MARPSRLGAYVKLSATYYQDDAILGVSTDAELLFVRSLAFCAGQMSDGFISDAQLKLLGVGIRSVTKRALELVASGLWARVDGGYVARSWQKWNKSAEEIGAERRRDRERKAQNRAESGEEFQTESERNPSGQAPDSLSEIGQDRTEIGQDTGAARADARFDDFWAAYPRKADKGKARKAWRTALRKSDPERIIEAAKRYAVSDDAKRDGGRFLKYPATWLNAEAWDNETLASVTVINTFPDGTPRKRYRWDFTPEEWAALPIEQRAAIVTRVQGQ